MDLNFTLESHVIFGLINFENEFSVSLGLFIRTFTNCIIFYLLSNMSQLSPLLLLQNHYIAVCMAMRYVTYAHGLCLVDPDNNFKARYGSKKKSSGVRYGKLRFKFI